MKKSEPTMTKTKPGTMTSLAPDSYNGQHFNRYLADAMGKGEVIKWSDFI